MTEFDEYDTYLAKWKGDNDLAESQPLTAGLTLAPSELANLSLPYPISLQNQCAEPEPSPTVTFRPAFEISPVNLSHAAFNLLYPLHAGPGLWAQVWVAAFRPSNSDPDHRIVIKLVQEALFPYPELFSFDMYESWCASAQCAKEAWAYTMLKDLQGSLIPHSYGFYDFILPCGQTVCGHVMELIDGDRLERDFKGMLDGSFYSDEGRRQRQLLLERLALSVHRIHTYGVRHGDLTRSNVLRPRNEPNSFIFLDFGRAGPRWSVSLDAGSDTAGLWKCMQELEEGSVVLEWPMHCGRRPSGLDIDWTRIGEIVHALKRCMLIPHSHC